MFDKIVNSVLVVVALTMAGFYVMDRGRRLQVDEVSEVDGWRDAIAEGVVLGDVQPADADIVLTEFVDFECPFCATSAAQVDSLRSEYGERLSVVVMHMPLSFHEQAVPAAIAAECADRQGSFEEFYGLAFQQQDSLGVKPWARYAHETGVPDMQAFAECLEWPADSFPRIEAGLNEAERTGVAGTPTFWVNQWYVPNGLSLRGRIEAVLAGKKP
jgi:protein-disulfide isomerase